MQFCHWKHQFSNESIPLIFSFSDQIDEFSSDVGGTLALWIGLSAMTIIEITELLLNILSLIMARLRKTRVSQNSE